MNTMEWHAEQMEAAFAAGKYAPRGGIAGFLQGLRVSVRPSFSMTAGRHPGLLTLTQLASRRLFMVGRKVSVDA